MRTRNTYHIFESVDRNEGIVSIVVITAPRTMANETQTFKANAALLEEGSSSNKKSLLLDEF